MASKGQMTGMLGVYLVAAELSRLGFIVSPTSRSAAGADLLVTDQSCRKAWSVQVKTNRKASNNWLLAAHAANLRSDSHVYVFVNIRGDKRPEYIVAPSAHVASHLRRAERSTGSIWYWFHRGDRPVDGEGWELFGDQRPTLLKRPMFSSTTLSSAHFSPWCIAQTRVINERLGEVRGPGIA